MSRTMLAATVATMICVAAYATAITTDTTVPLTADSAEDYVVAENVTLTFEVASGTVTHSGSITGAGKVAKTGSGTLAISGNNSYSGGFEQSAGTVRAESATAFGTGDYVANSGSSQLIFNAPDATFANNFSTSAKGTVSKPFLLF